MAFLISSSNRPTLPPETQEEPVSNKYFAKKGSKTELPRKRHWNWTPQSEWVQRRLLNQYNRQEIIQVWVVIIGNPFLPQLNRKYTRRRCGVSTCSRRQWASPITIKDTFFFSSFTSLRDRESISSPSVSYWDYISCATAGWCIVFCNTCHPAVAAHHK